MRPVDVEFEIGNDRKVIPQFLLIIDAIVTLRGHTGHHLDDGFGTPLAFLLVGQGNGIINHLLYLAPILGHDQFLSLRIVV